MPKYFDLRGIPKILAVFAVSSLLTIAAGANLRFADGIAGAALSLDGSKNATSSGRILMDGNTGRLALASVSSTVVTTTKLYLNSGTNTDLATTFIENPGQAGYYQNSPGYMRMYGLNGIQFDQGGALYQINNGALFPENDIARDLGTALKRWRTGFFGALGTNAAPIQSIYASSSAASLLPAITSSGTIRIANQGSPTTTIDLTGRLCIKALDMVAGTQRYLTIASGSLVITTTDCR